MIPEVFNRLAAQNEDLGGKPVSDAQLQAFCEAVTAKRNAYYDAQGYTTASREPHTFTRGPKFARIVGDSGVFCFVCLMTGDIYKAAGWKAPAKHVRGNIRNGAADVGPYGPASFR